MTIGQPNTICGTHSAMKPKHCNTRGGFTVLELVVVVVVLAVMTGWLIPSLAAARKRALGIRCVSHMKQIGTAARLWSGDHNERYPYQVPVSEGGLARTNGTQLAAADAFRFFQVMSNELNVSLILRCPLDAIRANGRKSDGSFQSEWSDASFTNNLVVSYFVGCNAAEDQPQMLLSGDRNIYGPTTTPDSNDGYGNSPTNGSGSRVVFGSKPAKVGWTSRIHGKIGNVAFADGSVQQLSSAGLLQAFANSGDTNTIPGANVIVFP